jgi:LysM repeat protein
MPTRQITVARGDTLSELAARHGIELQQIVALNRAALPNINHIEVGQLLTVPDRRSTPEGVAKSQ